MTHMTTRQRRTGAGVAVGALVASALLFTPSAQAAETITNVPESQIAPTEATYAGWHQGAENGKYRVVNEGLELVDRSQVIKGYADNKNENLGTATRNFDITKLPGNSFTVKSGTVSLQVPLFVDPDGTGPDPAIFTTLRTPLTTGGEVKATDAWESSKAFGAIPANTPTPLSTIIDAIKDNPYKVIAFGVYNETGTSVVSDITFDGAKYTFANNAPVARNRSYKTKIDRAVTVNLAATDAENQPLTYTIDSVTSGTMTVAGTTGTFTPDKGFKGDVVAKYTVKDNRGGTASAAITIKVEKLKGAVSIYRTHPTKPSIRSTVYLYATVMTDGRAASKGSTVYGYAKGKKVVTGKVNSSGKVKLKLPNKLPYGKATLKVTQAGSSKLSGGSDTVVVRVKK